MYIAFVIASAIASAMAGFGIVVRIMVGFKTGFKKQFWHLCVKVGFLITTGLILFAVLQAGRLGAPDWRTVVYTVGFMIGAFGMAGTSLQAARELVEAEFASNGGDK